MGKIWTIAKREYGAMVATKAFLVSITLMPVMMFGGIAFAGWMQKAGQGGEKTIVVADGTGGELFGDLEKSVEGRNAAVAKTISEGGPAQPNYVLTRHHGDELDDAERLALSEQIRNEKIAAFAEIPAKILDSAANSDEDKVRFYAQNPMLSSEKNWFSGALNAAVAQRRITKLGLDPVAVAKVTTPVAIAELGPVKKSSDGGVNRADEGRGIAGIFVPLGFMMLMLMVLMLSAQPMLEGVMEEKTGRIAEVLLGSVNTFQLMMGKLLGNVAGSLTVVGIYAVGVATMVWAKGWGDMVPMQVLPWFVIFQVLAVLLFGSIFLAIGAAVTQLKEAQSMLLPVWLLACAPMFAWILLVREPNGAIATWMSLFPFSAPMAMVLRLSTDAAIPAWQVVASMVLLLATAAAGAFIAGRIFRIGILWQGKMPRLKELVAWGLRG